MRCALAGCLVSPYCCGIEQFSVIGKRNLLVHQVQLHVHGGMGLCCSDCIWFNEVAILLVGYVGWAVVVRLVPPDWPSAFNTDRNDVEHQSVIVGYVLSSRLKIPWRAVPDVPFHGTPSYQAIGGMHAWIACVAAACRGLSRCLAAQFIMWESQS